MRSKPRLTFQQPDPLDRHTLPHKLLARQYQLVIQDEPRWGLSLEQCRRRMDVHRLVRLGRPVASVLLNTGRVEKVAGTDGLLDGDDIARVRVGFHDDLDTFTQPGELIPDVPYSA